MHTGIRFLIEPRNYATSILVKGGKARIAFDCGMEDRTTYPPTFIAGKPLDYLKRFGGIPDLPDAVDAVFVSHAHLDHYAGLFAQTREFDVYCSEFVRWSIERAYGWRWAPGFWAPLHRFRELKKRVEFDGLAVEPVRVSHSTIEPHAFIIETPEMQILYTGDFRTYGFGHTDFSKIGKVDVLLLDATNLGKVNSGPLERDVSERVGGQMEEQDGLLLVFMSPSNLGRMEAFVKLARKHGRQVLMGQDTYRKYLYGMGAHGFPKVDGVIGNDGVIDDDLTPFGALEEGGVIIFGFFDSPGSCSLVPRIHRYVDGSTGVVISHNTELNELSRIRSEGFKYTINRLGASVEKVHASGHAYGGELEELILGLDPKLTVPLHTGGVGYKELRRVHDSVIKPGIDLSH